MPPLFLAAALAFTPADATAAYDTASEIVENFTPRDAGTQRAARAAVFIFDSASKAGLDARLDKFTADTPRGKKRFTNVEAEYRSGNVPWVVFVSHYDTKSGIACPGANDGAATSGLLVALGGAAVRCRPKGVNILFIWTDGEECMQAYGPDDGLWGSRHAAEKLAAAGREVSAVVCLDMLGDASLNISIAKNGTPELRMWTLNLAKSIGLGKTVKLSTALVKDDHTPFLDKGFKAVDLIDFDYGPTPGSNDWWHTPDDVMEHVSSESLLTAGRLAAAIADGMASGIKGKGN